MYLSKPNLICWMIDIRMYTRRPTAYQREVRSLNGATIPSYTVVIHCSCSGTPLCTGTCSNSSSPIVVLYSLHCRQDRVKRLNALPLSVLLFSDPELVNYIQHSLKVLTKPIEDLPCNKQVNDKMIQEYGLNASTTFQCAEK